jgi:translation initiation factor 3 subunit G
MNTWAEQRDDAATAQDTVVEHTESAVDEHGIKTVTTVRLTPDGGRVRTVRRVKVEVPHERVKRAVLERRSWKPFGQAKDGNNECVIPADEIEIITPKKKEESKQGGQAGTVADFLGLLGASTLTTSADKQPITVAALPTTTPMVPSAGPGAAAGGPGSGAPGSSRYVPPSQRFGAGRGDMAGAAGGAYSSRPQQFTLRISNLPTDLSPDEEHEFKQMFYDLEPERPNARGGSYRPPPNFAYGTRPSVRVRPEKGIAFASYMTKEEAEKAMAKYDRYGWNNVRLQVEWAQP